MDHTARVRQEIIDAGVSSYGMMKLSIRHVPDVIHEDEHIKGLIYGWRDANTATLVATDRRLIYMDYKPFFRINDEISYDFVSGISINTQGRFSGVIVHTRAGDYNLRFVSTKCAKIFVKYIESRGIENLTSRRIGAAQRPVEHPKNGAKKINDKPVSNNVPVKPISSEVKNFLLAHELAVISTISPKGSPNAAVVNYLLGEENYFYILSKDQTSKVLNIRENSNVAITIFDAEQRSTVQAEGIAELISDQKQIQKISSKLVKPRKYGDRYAWPPISLLIAGDYIVIKVKPITMKYLNYN